MENIQILYVLVAFIIISLIIKYSNKRRFLRDIRRSFGKFPVYEFKKADDAKVLSQSFYSLLKNENQKVIIDDVTWRDLDLMKVFNKINASRSTIGADALYYRLRTIDRDENDSSSISKILDYFDKNEDKRVEAAYYFYKLGKIQDKSIIAFLDNVDKEKSNLFLHLVMGLIPIVTLLLAIFNVTNMALPVFLLSIIINAFYTLKKKDTIDTEMKYINYVTNSVNTSKKLIKMGIPIKPNLITEIDKLKFTNALSSINKPTSGNTGELMGYYISVISMLLFISYDISSRKTINNLDSIKKLWLDIGDVEAALCILNYREAVQEYCIPDFTEDKNIVATNVYHPLLKNAVKNDVDWNRTTLVSGSNASGKSTYVKSIAINAILAQTIYTCLADKFIMRKGNVITAMAVKDDIIEGDSYFIAEIKALKRITDDVEANNFSYYFIDEILKGTNTVERISASSSIISYFIKYDCLAFVATHDIELTKIYEKEAKNIHFRELFTDDNKIEFDYKLYQGPSTTTNAIKLLKIVDFPHEIVENAEENVENFNKTKSWYQEE